MTFYWFWYLAQTLPFCFGTLSVAMMQTSVPNFNPIPLGEITTPEEHRKALNSATAARVANAAGMAPRP